MDEEEEGEGEAAPIPVVFRPKRPLLPSANPRLDTVLPPVFVGVVALPPAATRCTVVLVGTAPLREELVLGLCVG